MVHIFPFSDCLVLTSGHEVIPEDIIKMQTSLAFGRKSLWLMGKPAPDVNKVVPFDCYSVKDLLLDLS